MHAVAHHPSQFGEHIWRPKDGYNLVAPVYDAWYWRPFWIQNEIPYVEGLLGHEPRSGRCLDLGCGTGTYCTVLERYGEVLGVDPSAEMLRVAGRRPLRRTRLLCGRARAIPLGDAAIEMTVAARSLCHEEDLPETFRELARVTVFGGTCILTDVHSQHDYPRTRIPFGPADVHIETFKRAPEEILDVATSSGWWQVEHTAEVRWKDLDWKPTDRRFLRIDRTSDRPIFFVVKLRRSEKPMRRRQ